MQKWKYLWLGFTETFEFSQTFSRVYTRLCKHVHHFLFLNPFTPKSAKFKTERKNLEFHFAKLPTTKQHMKVLLNSFHLNGHTLGFHPQPHLLTQGWTLGVKGLNGVLHSLQRLLKITTLMILESAKSCEYHFFFNSVELPWAKRQHRTAWDRTIFINFINQSDNTNL